MKKQRKLNSLTLNKKSISNLSDTHKIVGGASILAPCLTRQCPTDSKNVDCYSYRPHECIALPN